MKPYDTFLLLEDLNPSITKGMQGVILEIYDSDTIEVEFVKADGSNYEYNDQITFQLKTTFIQLIHS